MAQQDLASDLTQEMKDTLCAIDELSPSGMLKFYVAISEPPTPFGASKVGIRQQLRGFLFDSNSTRPIEKVSLYEGVGFASFLVKGIAGSLEDVISFAIGLREMVSQLEMFTFTILLGPPLRESDELNQSSFQDVHGVNPKLTFLIPDFPKIQEEKVRERIRQYLTRNEYFESLEQNERTLIGRMVHAAATGARSPETGEAVFSDILSAWFRSLESWIRPGLHELRGRKGISSKAEVQTMGDFLRELVQLLGIQESQRVSDTIAELRNRVQHQLDEAYLEQWEKTTDAVARWMPVGREIRVRLQQEGVVRRKGG